MRFRASLVTRLRVGRLVIAVVLLVAARATASDVVRLGPIVVPVHGEREVCEYRVLRLGRSTDLLAGFVVPAPGG